MTAQTLNRKSLTVTALLLVQSVVAVSCSQKPAQNLSSTTPVDVTSGAATEQTSTSAPQTQGANAVAPDSSVAAQAKELTQVGTQAATKDATQSSSAVGSAAVSEMAAPVAEKECLTFSFRHQATAQHTPGPDCIEHQNRIKLPQAFTAARAVYDINKLCVRVDGIAVRAVRNADELIVPGTPRSNSVISVRACPQGMNCTADCQVKRDDLMDDLAGETEGETDGWSQGAAQKVGRSMSQELKQELAKLDAEDINANWAQQDTGASTKAANSCSKIAQVKKK